ncbi:c-type cytochrome [Piscinibacter sp. XHJ-5]|uniref:c-type cytochrome n=1 Tax=Piscinibacter sp. XHJ-5 TaxID=3037797 RepID=UPI0024536E17|nr:c-type cytochrome [Piscinibacter sp. XHJ-5]
MTPIRTVLFLAAAACVAAAVPSRAAPVPDTIAERTRTCTACHGKEGRATREGYFPRIAGKPAGYLYNQLINFRDGLRSNAAMTYLVQHLTDDYLREMATYFASLDLPYAPPPPLTGTSESARLGETLVQHGDPARKIPACAQCHGSTLTGVAPAMPGLLGLPRDYVIAQFGAWRNGRRHAAAPDCMAQIAERLTNEDVSAVASWLASRPIPPSAKPIDRIATPLPLLCGSGLEGAAR